MTRDSFVFLHSLQFFCLCNFVGLPCGHMLIVLTQKMLTMGLFEGIKAHVLFSDLHCTLAKQSNDYRRLP